MATVIQATIVAILFGADHRTREALGAILFFESRRAAPALPYAIAGVIITFLLVLFRLPISDTNPVFVAVTWTVFIIMGEWVLTWLAFFVFLVVSIATGHVRVRM